MITFKISGTRYQIPTCWGDVTFAQYIELLKTPHNYIAYIALFTNIPYEALAKAQLKGVEKMIDALSFIIVPFKAEEGPSKMVGPYYIPKDVTLESLGQFEDLRALIQQLPKHEDSTFKKTEHYTPDDHILISNLYLETCAIYVQKIIDGEYDHEQVENVKHRLRTLPCTQVVQTGAFFFGRLLNTLTPITNRSQKILPRLKRLLLDFPGFQKSSDFLQRSLKLPNK